MLEQVTSELKTLLSEETANLDSESDQNESDSMTVSGQLQLSDWKRDMSKCMCYLISIGEDRERNIWAMWGHLFIREANMCIEPCCRLCHE